MSVFDGESRIRTEKRKHTIFLPLAMLFVVGGTTMLISTTQPLTVVSEDRESGILIRESPVEKVEVGNLTMNFPEINAMKVRPIPGQTGPVAADEPADKGAFVSGEILAAVDPLPESPELIPIVESDYLLDSLSPSDPPKKSGDYTSGLPKPDSVPTVLKAEQVGVPKICPSIAAVPSPCETDLPREFSKLLNQEGQLCLPGRTQRLRVGEYLDDPLKTQHLGRFLLTELAKGSVLRASVQATPDMELRLSIEQPEVPTARLLAEGSDFQSAVPIISPVGAEGSFTPWMTPEELNRHILAKNCRSGKSFWDQGNWITAVEGRVCEGGLQQYRIIYEAAPKGRKFQWRYRIAQSREDYCEKLDAARKCGFKLIQSQVFVDSTNTPRFQAVWHRM